MPRHADRLLTEKSNFTCPKYPCLYNIKDSEYQDREMKRNAWKENSLVCKESGYKLSNSGSNNMPAVRKVCSIFLGCMSAMYLLAFASLYLQIPGLYGNDGIVPVRLTIQGGLESITELLSSDQNSLVRLFPLFGLNAETMMDLVCLTGMFLSALSVIFVTLRCTVVYLAMWALYFSLFQLGDTFLSFQWDILLLEAGILAAIMAPIVPVTVSSLGPTQHDGISLWLVKWLLFRLMFASSVVKLQSHCPTWWSLTEFQYHLESQCIPTPLAYYMHQLPVWLLRLGVVQTYFTQIGLSLLFFSPLRSLRTFAFWGHVLHQVLILLTGNYNFFNLLSIVLTMSLLDDSFFTSSPTKSSKSSWFRWVDYIIQGLVYGCLSYYTIKYFSLEFNSDYTVSSQIAFSKADYAAWVKKVIPLTIWVGAVSLGAEVSFAVCRCFLERRNVVVNAFRSSQCLLYGGIAFMMFSVSLIPHTVVDKQARENLPTMVKSLFMDVQHLHITSSYGLFRRMTGVGGRPEVVIEGSHYLDRGWKEYDFLYKPGNVSIPPTFIAPHQPRLDWQMWFAALGAYHDNPWFVNLIYRLLTNERRVLDLLDVNPFPDHPPTYIRAILYHYHFTDISRDDRAWWWREEKSIYFPVITKNDGNFEQYLRSTKIIDSSPPRVASPSRLLRVLVAFRHLTDGATAFQFITILVAACYLLNYAFRYRRRE